MREARITAQLERFNATSGEQMVDPEESKRLVREQPFADSLPPYSSFFVTPDKTLWVVDYQVEGLGGGATAYRRDGAIVGRLILPAGSGGIVAFGDDRVVLRTADETMWSLCASIGLCKQDRVPARRTCDDGRRSVRTVHRTNWMWTTW